jgi:hypothetical protein
MLICGHVHIRKSIETSLFLHIWNGFCLRCPPKKQQQQREKSSGPRAMRSSIFVAFVREKCIGTEWLRLSCY